MKKKNILFIFVLIPMFFSQCSKKLDAITPKNTVPQDGIIGNDIATLRVGMYALMEDFVFDVWYDFDIRAVNYKGGPGFTLSTDPINMNPSDADIYTHWSKAYTTLNKINFVLKTIAGSSNPAGYNAIKGEALYLRALLYYNLVTRWGGVPILTEQTYAVVPRASETEVWIQIKTDLVQSEGLVPSSGGPFYITIPAVQALLARVYLDTDDNINAIAYCDKILGLNKFVLAPDALSYSSIFSAGGASKELIFALANNSSSNPHLFYQGLDDIDGSWNYSATTALFNNLYADKALAAGDKRRTAVFTTDNSRIIKFPNGVAAQQLATTSNANFTLIVVSRIAEIYLIKAEAQGAGAESAATLSAYLTARYANPPMASSLNTLSAFEFQNLILDERQREFYAEGQRWYDLKRTKRTDLLTTLGGRTYLLNYPIPQTEIDLAKYPQNPGY